MVLEEGLLLSKYAKSEASQDGMPVLLFWITKIQMQSGSLLIHFINELLPLSFSLS